MALSVTGRAEVNTILVYFAVAAAIAMRSEPAVPAAKAAVMR